MSDDNKNIITDEELENVTGGSFGSGRQIGRSNTFKVKSGA